MLSINRFKFYAMTAKVDGELHWIRWCKALQFCETCYKSSWSDKTSIFNCHTCLAESNEHDVENSRKV